MRWLGRGAGDARLLRSTPTDRATMEAARERAADAAIVSGQDEEALR